MLRSMHLFALAVVAVAGAGCWDSVPLLVGAHEPVQLTSRAKFHEGELPAAPNPDALRITLVDAPSATTFLGQVDRFLSGRTTANAHAVGVRFADEGSGWWVIPVDAEDPFLPGQRIFEFQYNVGWTIEPGRRKLRLVAIDREGRAGTPSDLDLCVLDDRKPDNRNACDPTARPPALVVSLTWDRDADLDLYVEVPSGKYIGGKTPTSAENPGNEIPREVLNDPTVGRLLRDSNRACLIDGRNAETIVFQETPEAGLYLVYANLFDACGTSGATFEATVHERVERDDGTFSLEEVRSVAGRFIPLQANGGTGTPLYLTYIEL